VLVVTFAVASMLALRCVATRVALADGFVALQSSNFDICLVDWAPKSDEQVGFLKLSQLLLVGEHRERRRRAAPSAD